VLFDDPFELPISVISFDRFDCLDRFDRFELSPSFSDLFFLRATSLLAVILFGMLFEIPSEIPFEILQCSALKKP